MPLETLSDLFLITAGHDKPDCLLTKRNGQFEPISTAEVVTRVHRLAKALIDLGVERGDRVALMAENGPHWPVVDFATLCIGAVLVPVYPTLTPDQAAYIVQNSEAKVVFAEGDERMQGLRDHHDSLPQVEHLVLIGAGGGDTLTLDALIAKGEGADPAEFERRAKENKPDDLATFIYTSGTTGNPKGVMLTHGNIVSNIVNAVQHLDIRPEYTSLSFLPLSHSFERTVDYIYFYRGCSIAYAESVQVVAQNLQEVKPHVFVSVPRVYEKVLAKVQENIAQAPALRQKIFHWAVAVGREALPYRLQDKAPPGLLGIKLAIADSLVFTKIRERLGGRFRMAVSGGAPLSRDVAEFFWGAGIPIYEGYGLSETSPVLCVNGPGKVRLGTVGRPIPNTEMVIADDGEILARGPQIMKGYFKMPEATAEAIDAEGWFHTGDIGEFDDERFLRITDRKKELIVNAYGKNVAPAPIENALKSSRFIGQVMVIGDRRNFLSALVVPDFEALSAWAAKEGIDASNIGALLAHPKTQKLFRDEIENTNQKLAKYERVHAWDLLPEDWSIEGGELTPTLKVKRRIVNKKYADQIEAMYQRAEKGAH
ncbi:MAG: long-chain fatty acid--CoA ligase [Acidobacteria bacterium]|nr:long-chain fatty acid--CoA ligase [Acidobacteriota bacterium]